MGKSRPQVELACIPVLAKCNCKGRYSITLTTPRCNHQYGISAATTSAGRHAKHKYHRWQPRGLSHPRPRDQGLVATSCMDGRALRSTGPSKPFDRAWDLGGAVTELGPGVDNQTFYPAGGGHGRRTTQRSRSTYCVDGIGGKGWVCDWVSPAATVVRAAFVSDHSPHPHPTHSHETPPPGKARVQAPYQCKTSEITEMQDHAQGGNSFSRCGLTVASG